MDNIRLKLLKRIEYEGSPSLLTSKKPLQVAFLIKKKTSF